MRIPIAILFLSVFSMLFPLHSLAFPDEVDSSKKQAKIVVVTKDVAIEHKWSGKFPVAQLPIFPVEMQQNKVACVVNADQWALVWAALDMQDDLPKIDFEKNFIVMVKNVRFVNRISIMRVTQTSDTLSVMAMETRTARPIDKVVLCALAVVPRAGVKKVSGGGAAVSLPPKNFCIRFQQNAEGKPGLKLLNKHTTIYGHSDENAWLQFSFKNDPFQNDGDEKILAAVKQEFLYCTVEVRFPSFVSEAAKNTPKVQRRPQKPTLAKVYCQLRGPLRKLGKAVDFTNMKQVKLEFTQYKKGRLKGRITGTTTKLTTETHGPNERTGDIAGVGHKDANISVPFQVEFNLSVDGK